jgi:predicted secreted Zn-dependent protease
LRPTPCSCAPLPQHTGALPALLLLVALLYPLTGTAEVVVQREFTRYAVPVQAGRSLRELLNAASPIRSDGRTFHAYTKWHVDWRFQTRRMPSGRCGIDTVHTTLTVAITLPGPSDPQLSHSSAFVTYLAALQRHEQGHYDIVTRMARVIDEGILTLPSEQDCEAMGIAANAFGNGQIEAAKRANAQYDRDTDNGRTQGAALP